MTTSLTNLLHYFSNDVADGGLRLDDNGGESVPTVPDLVPDLDLKIGIGLRSGMPWGLRNRTLARRGRLVA